MYPTKHGANTISFTKSFFRFILGPSPYSAFAPFQTVSSQREELSLIHVFSPHSTCQPSTWINKAAKVTCTIATDC